MKKIILTIFLIFNFLNADISENFPKLTGRVVDVANILTPEVKNQLTQTLKEEEEKTSNQIVVVVLNTLNGYSIEEYAYQLGRFWGIGQKDKNNGVILLISMSERKMRIEVGYGLEGALTDAISKEIIENTLKPNFKAQQYELGILKAVDKIITVIKGEYITKPENSSKNESFIVLMILVFILFSLLNKFSKYIKNQFLYKISSPFMVSSLFSLVLSFLAFFTVYYYILGIILFLILFIFSIKTEFKQNVDFNEIIKKDKKIEEMFGGTSGGSSSSSDSFSSGGGSFGGGGASGDW